MGERKTDSGETAWARCRTEDQSTGAEGIEGGCGTES